jgi:molybdenum cofactor cytidylyltransferase
VAPRVVGLLLAAGRGRRFASASAAGAGATQGDASGADKLLARIGGLTVAGCALRALSAGCDAVIAVVRPDASEALRAALHGARQVIADDADAGMGHSLAAAARAALEDAPDAVLVLPADMPFLDPATVRAIADAARAGPAQDRARRIVVPMRADGRRGHPVAFGAAHLPELARLAGDRGARALLERHPSTPLALEDPGILRDVDTPSDLPPS